MCGVFYESTTNCFWQQTWLPHVTCPILLGDKVLQCTYENGINVADVRWIPRTNVILIQQLLSDFVEELITQLGAGRVDNNKYTYYGSYSVYCVSNCELMYPLDDNCFPGSEL